MLTSLACGDNKYGLDLLGVQTISNVRGDFVERFSIFKDAYDRAVKRDEKNYFARQFLTTCTEDEVSLVRSIVGDVLSHGFNR